MRNTDHLGPRPWYPFGEDMMAGLPLREPTFLVLTALAAGAQHGYAILNDIRQISDEQVRLQAGTLYGILDRLGNDGLVELDHEEVVASRLRRYYRLTATGRHLLRADADRQHRNAAAAGRRLRGSDAADMTSPADDLVDVPS